MGFKWQQMGGKVYLDTNIDLVHVGNKAYTGDVRKWLADWKTKFENQGVVQQPTKNEVLAKYFTSPVPQQTVDDDMFKVL
jgi:hypothetical protein